MNVKKEEARKALPKEKKTSRFYRSSVGKPLTADTGFAKIRGIGESNRPGGYSSCKHELD